MSDLPLSPKHQHILDAARALFMADGYGKVSMEAIAKQAQVSKATLYAYFPSKDRLFATIVGDACRTNAMDESSFPETVTDMRAALFQIGERLLRFLLLPTTMAIYRVVVGESTRFPELGEAFMTAGPQAFCDRFATWLTLQSAAGLLSIPDAPAAAEQFAAMLRPLRFLRATLGQAPPEIDDVPTIVNNATETFLHRYAV